MIIMTEQPGDEVTSRRSVLNKRSTNIEVMRFLSAALVILSHAYPIVTGTKETELLYRLTYGQLTFGGLAVSFFFFVGGYFAAGSVQKEEKSLGYITKRLKRLLPSLGIVVLLSIIMGGFLTELSIKEYLTSGKTWLYLLNTIMLPVHNLPGVFAGQPYASTVNGALWTLPVEMACYMACLLWYRLGLSKPKKLWISIVFAGLVSAMGIILGPRYEIIISVTRPCILFYMGMLYRLYGEHIRKSIWIALICIGALIITSIYGGLYIAILLTLPYMINYFAFHDSINMPELLAQGGKISYAMYLVGFPIQQALVALKITDTHTGNFVLGLLLDIVIASGITWINNKITQIRFFS